MEKKVIAMIPSNPTPLLFALLLLAFYSCDPAEDPVETGTTPLAALNNTDREALYFMLEEEKLARDVYTYLGAEWEHPTFLNIQQSEARHMEAVLKLLQHYNLPYVVEAPGVFQNEDLQALYDSLIHNGSSDLTAALKVGALIEDLDIVDLQAYLDTTGNPELTQTFERLQCGSEAHLRSFTTVLGDMGESYIPQYLTPEWFTAILEATSTGCGP